DRRQSEPAPPDPDRGRSGGSVEGVQEQPAADALPAHGRRQATVSGVCRGAGERGGGCDDADQRNVAEAGSVDVSFFVARLCVVKFTPPENAAPLHPVNPPPVAGCSPGATTTRGCMFLLAAFPAALLLDGGPV